MEAQYNGCLPISLKVKEMHNNSYRLLHQVGRSLTSSRYFGQTYCRLLLETDNIQVHISKISRDW